MFENSIMLHFLIWKYIVVMTTMQQYLNFVDIITAYYKF